MENKSEKHHTNPFTKGNNPCLVLDIKMQKEKDYMGVGTGAVIIDPYESSFLLVKRKKTPEAGSWSVPGGSVEFSKTVEAAVIREVREEVGLDIEIIDLIRLTDHIPPIEPSMTTSLALASYRGKKNKADS